jgi:hypothetical protein
MRGAYAVSSRSIGVPLTVSTNRKSFTPRIYATAAGCASGKNAPDETNLYQLLKYIKDVGKAPREMALNTYARLTYLLTDAYLERQIFAGSGSGSCGGSGSGPGDGGVGMGGSGSGSTGGGTGPGGVG